MARRRGATDDQERERARTIYRRINPRVHGSEDYLALSSAPSGRALWLFLLSCREMTRIPGVILAGPLALAESIEWEPADFDRCLGEILDRGMAKIDRRARVLWLTHAHHQEEQRPENPNQVIGWRTTWDLIPECPIKLELWTALDEWMRTGGFPESILEAFAEACPKPRCAGSGNGSDNRSGNRYRNQEAGSRKQEAGDRREESARTDAIPAVEPDAVGCTSPEAPRCPSGASPVAEVEAKADDAPQPRGEASGAKVAPPPPVLVALVEPEPEDDPPRRVEPPADWGAFDEDLLDPDDAGAREGIAIYNAHRHLSLPEWSTARGCSPPAGLVATMRDDAAREREAGSGASLEPWGLHRRSGWLAFAEATHGAPKLHEWKWELGMFFTGANKGPRTCRGFEFRQTLARGGYVRSFDKPARETAAERQIRENVEATREAIAAESVLDSPLLREALARRALPAGRRA
jgi:hypothetical protein